MYDDIAKNRGIIRENCLISLKRPEWQQAADAFPPLNKRLTGQRRRRILGSFPQTENDVRSSSTSFTLVYFHFLFRKLVGVCCLNKQSRFIVAKKRIHYQVNINFLIGQSKVFIN